MMTLWRGASGTMFYRLVEETLLKLNPGIVTAENVGEIVGKIEGARNSIEGNAEILAWLRGDFVILHELLHLKIPNHGKLFRSLLRAYLPGCAWDCRGGIQRRGVSQTSHRCSPSSARARR